MKKLKSILSEWVWESKDVCEKICFKPKCVNRLTVPTITVAQELKCGLVMDMSRLVLKYMIMHSCKLQALTISEPW